MFWGGGIPNKKQTLEQVNKNNNAELAIYLNETETSEIPSYTSGYLFDEEASSCTSDATIRWDNETWSPIIQNIENYPVRCEIHFTSYCETHKEEGACKILAKGETDELKFDRTKDNNLRYVGSDPNNYVSFNGELWRIIGVMNNMELEDGTKSVSLLKLIRDESIGSNIWNKEDINDWTRSTLMNLLNNGAYYNRTVGIYYNNSATEIEVDFTTIGLTNDARLMIEDVLWNIGGLGYGTAETIYNNERGTDVYTSHETSWGGQIGLMYPSDYGYATIGGQVLNRITCLNISLNEWHQYDECYKNNWLYTGNYQWTITPIRSSEELVTNIAPNGAIDNYYASRSNATEVFPSLYLKQEMQIVSGSGSSTDPYILIKQ